MSSESVVSELDIAPEALLAAATAGLLAADPAALDDPTLHELIVGLQSERSRLAVAAADLVAEWDQRRLWESDGSRSPAHRLARDTHASVRTARTEIARARRIAHLPATRDAVVGGRLSIDHLDLFAHTNTPERRALFARDESLLIDQCTNVSFGDGARIVRYWTVRADDELAPTDPDPDGAPAAPHVTSRLHASRTLDDTLVIDGVFDPIAGTIIDNELQRLTTEIRDADKAAGIERTPAQQRAAALIEMARRSATAPANGRRPQPLFTVLVGASTFERLCELDNGAVIPPEQLLPHLRDALLESVLFDGPTTVIAVSSKRTFTGAIRRAIQVRDRRCQHPSNCDIPARDCDVDHVVPYSHGGPTSQFNARIQCPPHNRNRLRHDHDATPLRPRPVDRLDELRARLRWRYRNTYDDPADGTHAEADAG